MSVGVMEDYKLRDLRASQTLVGRGTGTPFIITGKARAKENTYKWVSV
jgi:hypothetical protein